MHAMLSRAMMMVHLGLFEFDGNNFCLISKDDQLIDDAEQAKIMGGKGFSELPKSMEGFIVIASEDKDKLSKAKFVISDYLKVSVAELEKHDGLWGEEIAQTFDKVDMVFLNDDVDNVIIFGEDAADAVAYIMSL